MARFNTVLSNADMTCWLCGCVDGKRQEQTGWRQHALHHLAESPPDQGVAQLLHCKPPQRNRQELTAHFPVLQCKPAQFPAPSRDLSAWHAAQTKNVVAKSLTMRHNTAALEPLQHIGQKAKAGGQFILDAGEISTAV